MVGKLLCLLGFHKSRFYDPFTNEHEMWVTIGDQYYMKCSRCEARTDLFTLTRNMQP